MGSIKDFVHYPVVTNPNSPQIEATPQFFGAGRARNLGKGADFGQNSFLKARRE
jgi:hypothetical protein